MHSKFIPLTAVLSASIISSCAPKFSDAQKSALNPVAVAKVNIPSTAYQAPNAANQASNSLASTSTTTAMGGGVLGALVGVAIESGMSSSQKSKFKNAHEAEANHASASVPQDLSSLCEKYTKSALKRSPFFSSRLKDDATAKLSLSVTQYGLHFLQKDDRGEVLFSPSITATAALTDNTGKEIWTSVVTGAGIHPHPISFYTKSGATSRQSWEEAAEKLGDNIREALAKKVGE